MKDYYQLELDDMVIELNNKDAIIEELEAELSEKEEKIARLTSMLKEANTYIFGSLKNEIKQILGEV